MESIWFAIIALMLTIYVVLDGFDLGAGAVHLFAARSEAERRTVLSAVGPVWDGNEVWLLAAGGALFCAFPTLYASSFSGFYLPLTIVLWLLIFRALGIEVRNHVDGELWHAFFDAAFAASSTLLTIFFGAALGNVIRGVPLDPNGYFFEPLWTNFRTGEQTGILDWYTILTGITAFVVLSAHGALYIALKTDGPLCLRSRRIAAVAWRGASVLTVLGLAATVAIRPELLANYRAHPVGAVIPMAVVACLGVMGWCIARGRDRGAFVASSCYIAFMLAGAAFALYPVLLPATTGADLSLTVYNAAASRQGLATALVWWSVGMVLACGYFAYVYRHYKGKVTLD